MTKTYLMGASLTTGAARWRAWSLTTLCAGLILAAGAVQAQTVAPGSPRPVGMVEQPCPTVVAPAVEPRSEAEIAAARQAAMERARLDWPGLCRHRAANQALGDTPVRAVFIGDSITEFWAPAAPDLFADGVVNRGIGAQTSPQMLARFYQDVISLRPRVVHIMAGTNDIAGNTGPSRPEDFRNNIRAMVELARAHDIAVVLGSIPPSAVFYWRPELRPAPRIAELNAWLRAYAAEQGAQFVDYAGAMEGPHGELRPELTGDGVHPDADGYAVMTPLARAAVERALASSEAPR